MTDVEQARQYADALEKYHIADQKSRSQYAQMLREMASKIEEFRKQANDAKKALNAVQDAMRKAYQNGRLVCCGHRDGSGECCGDPDCEWDQSDEYIMYTLHPAQKAMFNLVLQLQKGEESVRKTCVDHPKP